jgi:hypothetical protein
MEAFQGILKASHSKIGRHSSLNNMMIIDLQSSIHQLEYLKLLTNHRAAFDQAFSPNLARPNINMKKD